jgi:hypothetical protein
MAVRDATRRGMPWATGQIVAQRPGSETNNIRVFSAKGLSAPGTLGTSPLPQIGTPIPGTNLLYVAPRLSQDELGGAGGSQFPGGLRGRGAVHITNPEYAFYRERRRTPSIGMGGAGQMGATMGLPFESEVPYFAVP